MRIANKTKTFYAIYMNFALAVVTGDAVSRARMFSACSSQAFFNGCRRSWKKKRVRTNSTGGGDKQQECVIKCRVMKFWHLKYRAN